MNIIEILMVLRSIVHTFVRFLPLGIYSFVYLSTALFKDRRSAIILLGLVFNDIIGYLYKRYFKKPYNENCVVFGNKDNSEELGFLPNSHTEYISFLTAFFYSDMWYKYSFDFIPFFFLLFLLIITIWSRISVGCKTFKEAVFNIIFGALRGIIFFYFVATYYQDATQSETVVKKCDMGYRDYQCNEIVDGTVIIKNRDANKESEEESKKNQDMANYYD